MEPRGPEAVREPIPVREPVRHPAAERSETVRESVGPAPCLEPVRESVRAAHTIRPAPESVRQAVCASSPAAKGFSREPVRHPPAPGRFRRRGRPRLHDSVDGFGGLAARRLPGLGLYLQVLADPLLDRRLPQGVELLREADLLDETGATGRALVGVHGDGALANGAWHGVAGAGLLVLPAHDLLGLPAILPGARRIP